jgi:transcriptional regulator with XRE-family HTH domain
MADLKPIIAKNISRLRTSRGMTQIELAEKLNYSDKAISKWERGESVPDIAVLKDIADMFDVSLDYLVNDNEQEKTTPTICNESIRKYNRGFIAGMSVLLVWLIATLIFVTLEISVANIKGHWMTFVFAMPVSFIVWLVFNSLWFNRKHNFLIVSLLMWSVLAILFMTLSIPNSWLICVLGVPGQIIIVLWSRIKGKK